MNWMKLPNVKSDAAVCAINLCYGRQDTSVCGIQYDFKKPCYVQN